MSATHRSTGTSTMSLKKELNQARLRRALRMLDTWLKNHKHHLMSDDIEEVEEVIRELQEIKI